AVGCGGERGGDLPEPGRAERLGGGGVVSAVLEDGEGAELRVRHLLLEFGAGGEDVEAVAVVGAPGGGGEPLSALLPGPDPVPGAPVGVGQGPAVGDE